MVSNIDKEIADLEWVIGEKERQKVELESELKALYAKHNELVGQRYLDDNKQDFDKQADVVL